MSNWLCGWMLTPSSQRKETHDMPQVISKDGTAIAYDRLGQGPAVLIVGGILGDRSQQAPLAQLLASHFTVYNFDRRGRGQSGETPPYAVARGGRYRRHARCGWWIGL